MRKAMLSALFALLAISNLVSIAQAEYVPDEVIAKFKPNLGSRTKSMLSSQLGLTVRRSVFNSDFVVFSVPKTQTPAGVISRLKANTYILYAERNSYAHLTAAPNDPGYTNQWNLQTPDPTANSFGINVPDAWTISTGVGAQVAVVDTGCGYETFANYYANPDLDPLRIRPGWDFVNGDGHPNDDSDFGHGTHLCSLIGAVTNNGFGNAGIAPGCMLMPIKSFDNKGVGTADRIASGVNYASTFGAQVILIGGATVEKSQCVQDAITQAGTRGALVVAGTGNDGMNLTAKPSVQAVCTGVMYVGATARNGSLAPYSNRGNFVSVVAPGGATDTEGPLSETYSPYDATVPPFGFRYDGTSIQPMHGTSVAAAEVAGTAALVIGVLPGISPAMVRAQIENTALSLGDPTMFGHGLVDATAAVGGTTTMVPGNGGNGGGGGGGGGGVFELIDAAITGLTLPAGPVVVGYSSPVQVGVQNNGNSQKTITVLLKDEANGATVGSQDVVLTPGQTTTVSFTWTADVPAAVHSLTATATVSGDGNTANNTRSASVTVNPAQLQLKITSSKPTYRAGEWIMITFQATDGGLPAPGAQIQYSITGATGYAISRNAVATAGADGLVSITLTSYYSFGGRGTYSVQGIATRNGASTSALGTFDVTGARG
jgi:thermitase